MYNVKVDPLYFKLPQLLWIFLHHLIMMTSQRHHIKKEEKRKKERKKKRVTEIIDPKKNILLFHILNAWS